MRTTVFLDGKLLDPQTGKLDITNIVVSNGAVIGIGYVPDEKEDEIEKINIAGKWILPGITDVNTMVGEPGYSENETVLSVSRAAAHGGVTRLIPSPELSPQLDNTEKLAGFLRQFDGPGTISVSPMVSLMVGNTGEEMSEVARLKALGTVAASDLGQQLPAAVLKNAYKYLDMIQMPLVAHPFAANTVGRGVVHAGDVATMLGLPGISVAEEVTRISRVGEWAAETGAAVIILGISSARAIDLVAHLKQQGVRISVGVSIQHCWFTHQQVDGFDVNYKVLPPLRTDADQAVIRRALQDGVIDFIYADHRPWVLDRKREDFCTSEFGVSSLDCFWPLVYTKLVSEWEFPPALAYRLVSTNVCETFGLPSPALAIGKAANFTVVDPTKTETVSTERWFSLGKNSGYFGKTLSGWSVLTVVNGQIYRF